MEIKVGVPYKGSGVLNNYGQWTFTPSQVGSREGQKSLVKQEENYTLYSTKKKVVIYITLERGEKMSLIAAFCKVVDKLLLNFKDYDFRRILPNKNKGQKDK
jgi:hypothetical protein